MTSPSITTTGNVFDFGDPTPTFTSPAITTPSDSVWLGFCVQKGAGVTLSGTSVTSAGLTWTLRGHSVFSFSGIPYTAELWSAPLGSQTTYGATAVTVNLDGAYDGFAGIFFGVVGDAVVGGCTIDPNASLPATGGGTTPPPITFSTTKADDLLLFVGGSDSGSSDYSPVGFTSMGTSHIFPTNLTECTISWMQVSTVQTNVTLTYPASTDMVAVLTAETADLLSSGGASIVGLFGT